MERRTRYVMLFPLPDGNTAQAVRTALAETVQRLPEHCGGRSPGIRGKELAQRAQFTVDIGVDVYFCDPRLPWQCGSNENGSGLLRRYFTKGIDMSVLTQTDLDACYTLLQRSASTNPQLMTPSEKLAEVLQ